MFVGPVVFNKTALFVNVYRPFVRGAGPEKDPLQSFTFKAVFQKSRDGFGPVCKTYDETVQAIIDAVNDDCAVQPLYLERMDDFFAFSDQSNSERILKAIKKK